MGIEFNPFTGKFDFVGESTEVVDLGPKYKFILASLSSYDKIVDINYLDFGTKNQRIEKLISSSDLFPDSNIVKNISYLGVGTKDQRVTSIEYSGGVISPQTLIKTISYSLVGNRYKRDNITWSLI